MPNPLRTLALAAPLLLGLALRAQQHDSPSPQTQPSPSAQDDFTLLAHRMDVDVDGAPNAYGPPGSHTLDNLRDAHYRRRREGEIVGYLTEDDHPTVPILQGPHDPYPGYYISQTAFTDPARSPTPATPAATSTPRASITSSSATKPANEGARLGDFVTVTTLRTHRTVFAIIGDDGNPSGNEGSLHLLQSLGYPFTNGIDDAVTHPEILIHFYPNSNPRQLFPRTQSALDAAALKQGLKLTAPNQ